MTRTEALAEARKRWGDRACVAHRTRAPRAEAYKVGFIGLGGLAFMVEGTGYSWKAAFKDADVQAAADKARIARIRMEREQR